MPLVPAAHRKCLGISVYFLKADVTVNEQLLGNHRLVSDTGRWIEQQFCRNCGTAITWTLEYKPALRGIAGGTFDSRTFWYRLERFVFARSKPDWLVIPDRIEVCQAMPD